MGTGRDPRMREALRLARAGEKEQARQLLIEILRQDRDNFDAWIVMAQVTDDQREAVANMKQALRLRPDDERAQRYLDYLLHGDQQAVRSSGGVLKTSHWLFASLGAAAIICLAAVLIFFLPRLGSQEQANQPGEMSDAQPVADCTTLINDALEISDQGCQRIGRNEVCYGHNTVQAKLVPGSNVTFDKPGSTIPINILESFIAFPLDIQKKEWGVGVFKLEANLPGTLPGQLVTMLVFGSTSLQNASGDMQAFYFTSSPGGIRCDAVPFDGILVNMAEGAGVAFKANGADVTLQGNSILRAVADNSLVVTALRGTGSVKAFEREQSFGAGQEVTVPLGGLNGMEAEGPPNPPEPADAEVINAECTLTGGNCPGGGVAEQAATNTSVPVDPSRPTNTPVPIDPSRPTNTPVPVLPGQPTNTPVPLATNTPAPLPTNTPVPAKTATVAPGSSAATNTPKPGATSVPLSTSTSTKTPAPTATTPPPTATTPPPTATTPPPTATTPPPTATTPPPTATTPPPTAPADVCSTISVSWGGISNKKVTINITSGGATILETVNATWPAQNTGLKKINETNVDTLPITLSMSVNGNASLVFAFVDPAGETGYSFTLTFSGGCTKTFSH